MMGLLDRTAPAVVLAAMMAATLRRWVPVEERHLSRQFGESYEHYRARTPRWLGIPEPGRTEG